MKIISPTNAEYCFWDNENKHFLNEGDVDESDLDEDLVKKILLDSPWALGHYCYRSRFIGISLIFRAC